MIYTNKYNLPKSLVSLLSTDYYKKLGDISVTGLIQPPRIHQLKKRYEDQIEIDISDRIWAVLGSSVHSLLERTDDRNIIKEERLVCDMEGWKISGAVDLYEHPNTISDYKVTSVWSVLHGVKTEWEQQLNCYAHLYRHAGFDVDRLQIIAILRDWSQHQAKKNFTYPNCQIKVLPVWVWTLMQTADFLFRRIQLHQQAESMTDDELPECTPEERWDKPESWAVMKNNRKSALRVFNTKEEASEHLKTEGNYIEHRPGQRVRCEGYCDVKQFCKYYLKKNEKEKINEMV